MKVYPCDYMVQNSVSPPSLAAIKHAMERYGPTANTLLIDVATPEAIAVAEALGLQVVGWFIGQKTWAVTHTPHDELLKMWQHQIHDAFDRHCIRCHHAYFEACPDAVCRAAVAIEKAHFEELYPDGESPYREAGHAD